jgi:hypothetical protein
MAAGIVSEVDRNFLNDNFLENEDWGKRLFTVEFLDLPKLGLLQRRKNHVFCSSVVNHIHQLKIEA